MCRATAPWHWAAPPGHVHIAPDAAFALRRGDVPADRPGPAVAISVRDWPYFAAADGQERYERAIAALCRHLVEERGSEVVFLSTCQGADEYWTDDSQVAVRIADALPEATRTHVIVDRDYHRPDDLRDTFAAFDAVVATRLHAAILALDAGTPVVGIAYERKTHEVFTRLELADVITDIEHLNAAVLIELVDKVLDARPAYAARPRAAVEREARAADQVADLLRDVAGIHAASTT